LGPMGVGKGVSSRGGAVAAIVVWLSGLVHSS